MFELKMDTAIERHDLLGREILVKREDTCWPWPATSKARGARRAILDRPGVNLAVVDTGRSTNGLLVAALGRDLGREVAVGYPVFKGDPGGKTSVASQCDTLGVETIGIPAASQWIMRGRMAKILQATGRADWFLFPTGLRLQETVDEVAAIAAEIQRAIAPGVVIVPSGTGTHCAGVMRGVACPIVAVQGYFRPEARFRSYVARAAGLALAESDRRLRVIGSVLTYYESRPDRLPPFPANLYYEAKAWAWLRIPGSLESLPAGPIVFWNIGA